MLNILVLDYDFSHSYYKNSIYLWNELKKITNCVLLTPMQNYPAIKLDDLVDMCPFKPDFIIINEFVDFYHQWSMKGLEKVNIPIGYMPHDVDAEVDIRREYLNQNNNKLDIPII